jgi:hypothetical protein
MSTGGSAATGGSTESKQVLREILDTTIARSCIGCRGVSVCGSPPISDQTVLGFSAFPSNDIGVPFAAERMEGAGRALQLGSCKAFQGAEFDAIAAVPSLQCMSAGELALKGGMSLLQSPMSIFYDDTAQSYVAIARPQDDARRYQSGTDLTVSAAGGPDIGPFEQTAPAPETIEILSPTVSAEGSIQNINKGEPLTVRWAGGGEYPDVVVAVFARYCGAGPKTFVACHAANDGELTIPADVLNSFSWPNSMELTISASIKIALPAAELIDPVWSVRSHASVHVYYDDAATPPAQTCNSTTMSKGYVGAACGGAQDCGGGCCLMEVTPYFAGNYCTVMGCTGDADCPEDAACATSPSYWRSMGNYCAKRCSTDADCRAHDYACLSGASGIKACRPNFM